MLCVFELVDTRRNEAAAPVRVVEDRAVVDERLDYCVLLLLLLLSLIALKIVHGPQRYDDGRSR